ncbi:hypothetical protein HWV62_7882 [Athelia sp. TMB]|nr:hypothetical protein HWV62_7882 [Athelia sp. TMB]
MVDNTMDVDDIDAESLQAQIDMSMSLVQNLVSSWMKPSKKPMKASNMETEKELEELMRRPPRLGVGASIPETSVASRDAARLKHHLTSGKKRMRDDAIDNKNLSQSSDDEDSRAAVVRKKSKPDPFANSKKKGSQLLGLMSPRGTPTSSQNQPTNSPALTVMDVDPAFDASSLTPAASPRKKKKKKKKGTARQVDTVNVIPVTPPLTPARHSAESKAPVSQSPAIVENAAAASPAKETSSRLVPPSTPKFSSPTRVPPFPTTSAAFSVPLLNLDGPPPDVRGTDVSNASPGDSMSAKRRKRRKKKKTHNSGNGAANKVVDS